MSYDTEPKKISHGVLETITKVIDFNNSSNFGVIRGKPTRQYFVLSTTFPLTMVAYFTNSTLFDKFLKDYFSFPNADIDIIDLFEGRVVDFSTYTYTN